MRADDKTYHLYVWDTTDKKITLKEKALKLNSLSDEISILEIDTGKFKVVGLSKDSIFEFEIPVFEARLVCGYVVWNVGELWYTFEYETSKVRLLGIKKDRLFSLNIICRIDREDEGFFIETLNNGMKLTFIRPEGIISVEGYSKVSEGYDGRLIAFKDEVYCDVYIPYPPYLLIPSKRFDRLEIGHDFENAYFWQEDLKMWACLGRGVALARNAFQTHYLKDNKPCAILYKVQGIEKVLVAEGEWQHQYVEGKRGVATCIDGLIYKYCETENNVVRRLVDFDNPVPTLIKKVKDCFK